MPGAAGPSAMRVRTRQALRGCPRKRRRENHQPLPPGLDQSTIPRIISQMSQNYRILKKRARQMRNVPTDAERTLWYGLRKRRLNGYPFLRQRVIDGMIVDFVCRKTKLVIEVDGGQHDERKQADAARTQRLNSAGYRVLRFWNNDVALNTQAVLQTIDQTLIEQDLKQANQLPQRRRRTPRHPQ